MWNEFETSAEVSNSSIWIHTTCATRVFFFHYSRATSDDQLSSNFHRFIILCMHVCIRQVRRVVFDNNQRCQVPLSNKAQYNLPAVKFWWNGYCYKWNIHFSFMIIYNQIFSHNNFIPGRVETRPILVVGRVEHSSSLPGQRGPHKDLSRSRCKGSFY